MITKSKTEGADLRARMLDECARSAGRIVAVEAGAKLVHTVRLYTQGDYTNDHVRFETKEERSRFWNAMRSAFESGMEGML